MKYSTIRKEYQHHELSTMVFVDPYATLLSPFVTKMCIKLHLIPNAVTLCMIGSGIIGAILFALPFLWSKNPRNNFYSSVVCIRLQRRRGRTHYEALFQIRNRNRLYCACHQSSVVPVFFFTDIVTG